MLNLLPLLATTIGNEGAPPSGDEMIAAALVSTTIYPNTQTFRVTDVPALEETSGATVENQAIPCACFSRDGTYLVVGASGSGTTRLFVFKRSGYDYTELVFSDNAVDSQISCVAISPDNNYIAYMGTVTDAIRIYKRSVGDTFAFLTSITSTTVTAANAPILVDWSPSGTYMVVHNNAIPYVQVLKQTGDSFVNLGAPTDTPTTAANIRPFPSSPPVWNSDESRFAIVGGVTTNGRLHLFARSGDSFSLLSTAVAQSCQSCVFMPDDRYIGVGTGAVPRLRVYDTDGGVLVQLANPVDQPTTTASDIVALASGLVVVAQLGAPHLWVYSRTAGVLTLVTTLTLSSDPNSTASGPCLTNWPRQLI